MRRLFFTLVVIFTITTLSFSQDKYEIITSHPRVILSKEADLTLQFLFLENEGAREIQQSLKINADMLVEKDQIKISTIQEFIEENKLKRLFYEVSTLAMAYRLFEDVKYSNKVTEYLLAISSLESWGKAGFETLSDLAMINALGYDWLFYELTRADREIVRNAIVQKGLNPLLDAFVLNADTIPPAKILSVTSGMVLGSLAVADDFPELNKRAIYRFLVSNQRAIESLTFKSIMETYGEDWNKNAADLAMVLASLHISLGHDFNITTLENIKSFSSDYLSFLENDNHSENEKQQYILNPALLWFGKLNSNVKANEFFLESVKKYHLGAAQKTQLNYVCLLWMI